MVARWLCVVEGYAAKGGRNGPYFSNWFSYYQLVIFFSNIVPLIMEFISTMTER
jgi:hypothetical protein